jgi:hypothetical protein
LAKPSQRKFRNYLLNKSLQLRYVLLVTAVSALISASLGFVIWREERMATRSNVAAFDAGVIRDQEVRAEIVADQTSHDTNVLALMAITGAGLMAVLTLYLVVMTHKVAGPLYKVGLTFDLMAQGRLGRVTPLRKGDMLVDFYEHFRGVHDAVRKRHQEQNAAVGRFLSACDAAGVSPALGAALEELRDHHRERTDSLA